MTKNLSARVLRRNNRLYIVQAAAEYHISLLVTGSFLAALTSALGMSDALTGVLSSVISLGCVFQLVSLLLRPRAAKGFVAVCSVLNQLLFAGLYQIPFLPLGTRGRIAVFVVGILAAYFIYNMAHPQKVGWLPSRAGRARENGAPSSRFHHDPPPPPRLPLGVWGLRRA